MKLLLFALGLLVAVVRSQNNPQCPKPPTGLAGICVFTDANCLQDSECLNGQVCCSHLCGKICKDKVSLTISKPGTCPSNAAISCFIGSITDSCSADSDCPGDQKCCNLCGKTCSAPEGSGPQLPPFDPPVCPVVDCFTLQFCQFGYRLDSNGCQTCTCKKTPCELEAPMTVDRNTGNTISCGRGGVRCPSNSECKIHPADRYAVCCPKVCPPVCEIYCPYGNVADENGCATCTCKKTPCEGQAPLILDSNGNSIFCGLGGASCPSNSECNVHPADAYAVCCPTEPVVFPPVCPVYDCLPSQYCEFGYKTNSNGCQTCECLKTPCEGEAPMTVDRNTGNTINCGRGGVRCPSDSQCKIHPADRYAVCCPKQPIVLPPLPVYKPGSCPVPPSPFLLRCASINRCKYDSECEGTQKCCDHPCGKQCRDIVKSKAGVCLKSADPATVLCKRRGDDCYEDSSCSGSQKCCQGACGNACMDTRLTSTDHEGTCPALDPKIQSLIFCASLGNECELDSDCNIDQKCCNDYCGIKCVKSKSKVTIKSECPAVKTNPFYKWFCHLPRDPPCKVDGDCSNGEMCCPGTCYNRCLKKPIEPVCNPNPCGDAQIRCQYGQQKDKNGCLMCNCNLCKDGLPSVNCFADPCQVTTCNNPAAIRCVSNYCGGCNAVFYDTNGYEVDCPVAVKGK